MFNDIGVFEIVTLVILAVLIFGPDKLPKFIQDASRTIRKIRQFSDSAKQDIRDELGPEFKDFEFDDLNPKKFIRKQMERDDLGLKEIRNGFDLRKEMAEVTDSVHGREGEAAEDRADGASRSGASTPAVNGGGRIDMEKRPAKPAADDHPPFDADAT